MFFFGSSFVFVCVHIHFFLEQVLSIEGVVLGEELLVEYNGQKFRHNDLVDVIVGTGPGVRWDLVEVLVRSIHDTACSKLLHLEHVFLAPEKRDISRN